MSTLFLACKNAINSVETNTSQPETTHQRTIQSVDSSTLVDIEKTSDIVHYREDLASDETMGFGIGDTIPNVILYHENGRPFELYSALDKGQPILLVSGSFTCPIYRRKVSYIDYISDRFGDKIKTYVVYTIEAHPNDINSPYRDSIWVSPHNYKDKILVAQARTFGDRVTTAKEMVQHTGLETPLLFDGPDNEYWHRLGQAPVFAYLILPNRVIAGYQKTLRKREFSAYMESVYSTN